MYAHVCTHKHTLGNFVYFYMWAEIINLNILAVFQHICWTNCHITNLKIWGSHCCFKIILLNATNPKLNIQYIVSPEKDFEIILYHFGHLVCILSTQTQQVGFPVMHLTAFTTVYVHRHQRKGKMQLLLNRLKSKAQIVGRMLRTTKQFIEVEKKYYFYSLLKPFQS